MEPTARRETQPGGPPNRTSVRNMCAAALSVLAPTAELPAARADTTTAPASPPATRTPGRPAPPRAAVRAPRPLSHGPRKVRDAALAPSDRDLRAEHTRA
ncbi:hypothetical protein CERSUDRAFT_96353 [Gelatoporia subvermispora B]|uniref:Uncharacterized protein n=1 Tax=Ceriporiopsis subvermispora (strain B) TaxID=914234 RepID=M2RCJ1_CERS8|nr:hypothetical protein CERSUDRAFT_96353 [Gelatoporia subvermispora B]